MIPGCIRDLLTDHPRRQLVFVGASLPSMKGDGLTFEDNQPFHGTSLVLVLMANPVSVITKLIPMIHTGSSRDNIIHVHFGTKIPVIWCALYYCLRANSSLR